MNICLSILRTIASPAAVLCVFGWFLSVPVSAAPVVIHDAGPEHTQSMETYMRIFKAPARFSLPDSAENRKALQQEIAARAKAHGHAGGVRVPIRTSNMRPARIESRDAYFPNLVTPVFIVGADANSLAWLRTWREVLFNVGAVGWVVQAEDAGELRAIAEAGRGLRMMTLDGESIPEVFGVSSYPVLITSRAIEQ
jgi:integrating conjugative element protein (TIGR03765 family)